MQESAHTSTDKGCKEEERRRRSGRGPGREGRKGDVCCPACSHSLHQRGESTRGRGSRATENNRDTGNKGRTLKVVAVEKADAASRTAGERSVDHAARVYAHTHI